MVKLIQTFFTPIVGKDRAWRFSIMLKAFGDVFFYKKSFFSEIGWLKAYDQKIPVDNNNNPLPWVTYSFIDFVTPRLDKRFNIFEYGSGYSTLYYSKYVNKVYSVEHDKEWYEGVKDQMRDNVELHYVPLSEGEKYVSKSSQEEPFQLVIVDGRRRNLCLEHALEVITEDGVIVLDDSERDKYKKGKDLLIEKGFKEITFTGIAPGMFLNKSTTIFYRNQNCLNI
ncbi:class I SAM-dependent methyltransferase [Sediminitomix flava]|uniref:Methyltransferase family protein n=1 Tax=Sediminitomix flava TaxID=379075 RepID=A0A315Z9E5_SEDFL|nr:class I SAM-dependent methyltransferase [Sediminitomix flava]PWJ40824.1 methyltransferase family protein [Sediminitomix flava]